MFHIFTCDRIHKSILLMILSVKIPSGNPTLSGGAGPGGAPGAAGGGGGGGAGAPAAAAAGAWRPPRRPPAPGPAPNPDVLAPTIQNMAIITQFLIEIIKQKIYIKRRERVVGAIQVSATMRELPFFSRH